MSYEIDQESYCSMVVEVFDRGNAGKSRYGHGMNEERKRKTLKKNTMDPEDRIIRTQLPEVV